MMYLFDVLCLHNDDDYLDQVWCLYHLWKKHFVSLYFVIVTSEIHKNVKVDEVTQVPELSIKFQRRGKYSQQQKKPHLEKTDGVSFLKRHVLIDLILAK